MSVEAMPETSQVPLTDDTTKQLTLIWQEILGVDSITPDQNYFDLGGDSSVAVQLFAQIDKTFGVKLPLAALFDAPTINELARVLRREESPTG
ncbi:MAG: acyl carrier protein, partial [Candidatus Acidiferrales bacterium]